jgi:8-oxo-dGTP diphosphatase
VSTLEFQRSLPAKRMGAGLLLRDAQGRVLVVEPTYKPDWEIPGGAVDVDESPRQCVVREVGEELGIGATPGRLLVIDYQHPEPGRTESIMFVFDGGVVDTAWTDQIELAADELHRWRLVALDELSTLAIPRLCRRIDHAVAAAREGQTLYLENGQRYP